MADLSTQILKIRKAKSGMFKSKERKKEKEKERGKEEEEEIQH